MTSRASARLVSRPRYLGFGIYPELHRTMIYYPLNCVFFNIAVFLVIALSFILKKKGRWLLGYLVLMLFSSFVGTVVGVLVCLHFRRGGESELFGIGFPLGGIVGLLAVFLMCTRLSSLVDRKGPDEH